jgi:hypothetical protein
VRTEFRLQPYRRPYNGTVLKIGDFSTLTLVSIKALRHYDELGLLKPVRVDELQLLNLSAPTTRAYLGAVERFAQYFQKSPRQLGVEQVREYLLHLIRDHKAPPNRVKVNRSALRFLYVCTLKQSWFEENIPQPKRPPTLPDALSTEEVTLMLDSICPCRTEKTGHPK